MTPVKFGRNFSPAKEINRTQRCVLKICRNDEAEVIRAFLKGKMRFEVIL